MDGRKEKLERFVVDPIPQVLLGADDRLVDVANEDKTVGDEGKAVSRWTDRGRGVDRGCKLFVPRDYPMA